ncbi:MAG: hypothetical protein ACF8XB_08775 [Planctomycetota bacterium JB042]
MSASWRARFGSTVFGVGLGLGVAYVVLNVLMILFVPILHRLTLTLHVVDERTGSPVRAAVVGWRRGDSIEPLDSALEEDAIRLPLTLQGQPSWFWPSVGTFDLDGIVLRVDAEGYEGEDVRLAEKLPRVSYADPRAALEVRLSSRE